MNERNTAVAMSLALVLATGCGQDDASERAAVAPAPEASVVELTALDYAIIAPATIPQGWTTFRLTNTGSQAHFVVIWPLPEGRTFDDYLTEVIAPFEALMHTYHAGDLDRDGLMTALGEEMPEWAFEVLTGAGGPGLTSPGSVSMTTVNLEPGDYVLECYVRAPDGNYHSMMGMLRPITVTAEPGRAAEPSAEVTLTLSNYAIGIEGELAPGENTVRVFVADDPEGMLKHDVHLARLDDDTGIDEVVAWMDWVDAMQAPAPVEFLGGVEQMTAGSTGYLHLDLEPGRYAWISEEYGPRGMVETFTVE